MSDTTHADMANISVHKRLLYGYYSTRSLNGGAKNTSRPKRFASFHPRLKLPNFLHCVLDPQACRLPLWSSRSRQAI